MYFVCVCKGIFNAEEIAVSADTILHKHCYFTGKTFVQTRTTLEHGSKHAVFDKSVRKRKVTFSTFLVPRMLLSSILTENSFSKLLSANSIKTKFVFVNLSIVNLLI